MKKAKKIIGAGLGLAALTAAGLYFLRGQRGARAQKAVRGWALKLKGEVLERLEDMKTIDRDTYLRMVERTAARYAGRDGITASELQHLTVELKNAWVHIGKKTMK